VWLIERNTFKLKKIYPYKQKKMTLKDLSLFSTSV
jgi:hypothetical protein